VRPTIIDLATIVRMSRISGPNRVRLGALEPGVDFATIPAERGEAGGMLLTKLFGDLFVLKNSILAISLNNHNPIYHIPAMVFKLPLVERRDDWNIWANMTPLTARYVQKLDGERMAVAKCFGVDAIPLAAYVRTSVGLEGEDLPSLFAAAAKKRPAVTGPKSIEDRYMTEDMPYGMVFFRTLGQVAG
jgi:opine dehydrogenase